MSACWPAIIPFEDYRVPAFPVDALPEPLKTYVAQVAESFQVPVDLPACLSLAVVAASIAKVYAVRVSPDWREPTNLFTVVVLPSGQRKSPVFRELVQPLEVAERAALNAMASTQPEEQAKYRLLVDDVSPEQLAILLARNEGRLALMSSEGGAFEMMAGRYNRGVPNLDVYLKGHAGDTIRIDRRDGTAEIVTAPALTIGLTIQPDVLDSLASRAGFRGQGLLARFLYAVPRSILGHRKIEADPVSPQAREAFRSAVTRLLDAKQGVEAGTQELHLEDSAACLLRELQQYIEALLAPGKALEPIADWANKLPGNVVRIAAGFHCIAHRSEPCAVPISAESLGRAVALANYFQAQALAAFNAMGVDPVIDGAKYLLRWLSKTRIRQISARNLFQETKGHFKRMSEIHAPLGILEERGYVRRAQACPTPEAPGRPPSPIYEISPALYQISSQNPQNPRVLSNEKESGSFLRVLGNALRR